MDTEKLQLGSVSITRANMKAVLNAPFCCKYGLEAGNRSIGAYVLQGLKRIATQNSKLVYINKKEHLKKNI
jgi:hypothetical protein